MPKIIRDFIKSGRTECGVGYFAGDILAVEKARKMTKNQIRQFKRHGLVPGSFISYLKDCGIIPITAKTSKGSMGRTIHEFLEFLWTCPCKDEAMRDAMEFVRKLILTSVHPELKSSFCGQDRVWRHLERAWKEVKPREKAVNN